MCALQTRATIATYTRYATASVQYVVGVRAHVREAQNFSECRLHTNTQTRDARTTYPPAYRTQTKRVCSIWQIMNGFVISTTTTTTTTTTAHSSELMMLVWKSELKDGSAGESVCPLGIVSKYKHSYSAIFAVGGCDVGAVLCVCSV